jgi:hypothetical protein
MMSSKVSVNLINCGSTGIFLVRLLSSNISLM